MTPNEQRLKTKYGTSSQEEIIAIKKTMPQSKDVLTQKAMNVRMTPEECLKLCKSVGVE